MEIKEDAQDKRTRTEKKQKREEVQERRSLGEKKPRRIELKCFSFIFSGSRLREQRTCSNRLSKAILAGIHVLSSCLNYSCSWCVIFLERHVS